MVLKCFVSMTVNSKVGRLSLQAVCLGKGEENSMSLVS